MIRVLGELLGTLDLSGLLARVRAALRVLWDSEEGYVWKKQPKEPRSGRPEHKAETQVNPLKEVIARDRRLAILRFLHDAPGCEMNTSMLRSALDAIGHAVSRDTVEADVCRLCDKELVAVERLENLPVTVVTITERGMEVAQGKAHDPDVKKPTPR
jgi:hypothetical protein